MRATVAFLGCGLLLCLSCLAGAQPIDENTFVQRIRDTELNCTGAARPAQEGIVARLVAENSGRRVTFASAVVAGFQERVDAPYAQGCLGVLLAPCAYVPIQGAAAQWEGRAVVYLKKDYQDRNVIWAAAIPLAELPKFRAGQKVSGTLEITSFGDYPGGCVRQVGMVVGKASYVFGSAIALSPETTSLKCANGHEYAPSAGFKFCPVDGLPLR